ncbi:hypothetical protein ACWGIU_14530 [Streptomyces sp. NPDC054840]
MLGWSPEVDIDQGLRRTSDWSASRPVGLSAAAAAIRGGQENGMPPPRKYAGAVSDRPASVPAPA